MSAGNYTYGMGFLPPMPVTLDCMSTNVPASALAGSFTHSIAHQALDCASKMAQAQAVYLRRQQQTQGREQSQHEPAQ